MALRRLDAWLDGRRLEDATLAAYLAELHDQGSPGGERLDGGGRGLLPSPPRRRAESGWRRHRLGPRGLPVHRLYPFEPWLTDSPGRDAPLAPLVGPTGRARS